MGTLNPLDLHDPARVDAATSPVDGTGAPTPPDVGERRASAVGIDPVRSLGRPRSSEGRLHSAQSMVRS